MSPLEHPESSDAPSTAQGALGSFLGFFDHMTKGARSLEEVAGGPDNPYAVPKFKHGGSAHAEREIRIEGPDALERQAESNPILPGANPSGLNDDEYQ